MNNQLNTPLLVYVGIAFFAGLVGSVSALALQKAVMPHSVEAPVQASSVEKLLVSEEKATAVSLNESLTGEVAEGSTNSNAINSAAQLRTELDVANAERSSLAMDIVRLTRQVDALTQQLEALEFTQSEPITAGVDGNLPITAAELLSDPLPPPVAATSDRSGQQRVESLVAAGVDAQTARDLQARQDQFQLARLELFDQAAREGWSDSDQLSQRLTELDASRVNLREELGDDAYDRYLFESGQNNRIAVASVIAGSAADLAGLSVGDQIISYAGSRVFRIQDLQDVTREGQRGEFIQILFDRGGQLLSTDITRGPMGVTLRGTVISP